MTTANEYERQQDFRATLVDGVLDLLGPGVLADPTAADIVNRVVDRQLALSSTPGSAGSNGVNGAKRAGDDGFGDLVGIGSSASGLLGDMQVTPEVIAYDDVLKS